MDSDLSLSRIEEAARAIDPVFLNTPQYFDEQLTDPDGNKWSLQELPKRD